MKVSHNNVIYHYYATSKFSVEMCHDLAKWLSQYLYLFSIFFYFIFLIDGHARQK